MAQQPMTQFWPIFASKSDGQDVVNQKGRILRNGPTQEQLDKSPNDQGQCDFYRLIEKDDPKHVDWRKKLGGMLLREIGGKQNEDKWQQCILWDLPDNYVLYEHIKTKADGQLKTVKNHSGGGHDRQDAYLYGYPKGPKKRFRSPVEFFPHLLWLCTDESTDYNNCTCKMCSPMQPEVEKQPIKVEARSETPATIKREPTPNTPAGLTVVGQNPIVQIPVRKPSLGATTAQSPGAKPVRPVSLPAPTHTPAPAPAPASTPAPAPNMTSIRAPPPLQSTPLPQPRTVDQQVDLLYNRFLCRTGEVVWFYRPKAVAWGLGLVIRRWAVKDSHVDRAYMVQPLSHPFEALVPEVVTSDNDIKPWLAWSAPACTFTWLQQNPQLSYAQIDWRALESGRFGEGVASVDASILAAKAIDSTYTLFEHLSTNAEGNSEVRHYNGIYLGAEKIWKGEAVRLRIGTGSDLMVVTDIFERVFSNAPQKQANTQPIPPQVSIVGDIYSYATLDAPDQSKPPQPPQQNANIPARMAQDMIWRNRMLVPLTRTLAWWRLMAANSKLDISDVKGRWYETSVVFEEPFTKAVKNNEGGNGIWMNSRGDATGLGKNTGIPRSDRIGAFANSIPKNTQLVHGIDAPPNQVGQQQQQQDPLTHNMQNMDIGTSGGGNGGEAFSLDDFMNVDHLGEDTGMEFANNFHF